MENHASFLVLLACVVSVISGCASQEEGAGGVLFEFFSGGACHPQGFGEWRITVDQRGSLSVAHDVRGRVTDHGTFALSDEEDEVPRHLIRPVRIEEMMSCDRPGIPDEVQHTFILSDGGDAYTGKLWVGGCARERCGRGTRGSHCGVDRDACGGETAVGGW